jgi:protein-S-isoprenylcysteine O-methyltransferase Ste14
MAVDNGFAARGGWWVAWQFPLLVLAYFIPVWTRGAFPFSPVDPVATAGVAVMLAGGLLFVAATVKLGRAMTPFPRPIEGARLRTSGIYALVRHPIYTGVLCLGLGWSLYQHSIAGLAFELLLFAFFDRKAAREEHWLAEMYPEYTGYRQRVKKLIPLIY